MARTLPTTIVQAFNAQTTSILPLVLLTVTHSSFTAVRVVNNTQDVVSNSNTFTAFPFTIVLPADTEELEPVFRVTITNVTRLLIEELRTIAGSRERALVTIHLVEYDDPDTVLIEWSDFEMADISYNATTMAFALTIESFLTEPFPALSFTPSTTPGVF